MDQQPPAPAQMNPAPVKRQDATKWIVIILLIIATIGTGIAYVLFTNPDTQQIVNREPFPTTSPENEPEILNLNTWEKYTNPDHKYSIVYSGSWKLETGSDGVDFILKHISTTQPGSIEGEFLPPEKVPQNQCYQNSKITENCIIYQLTENRTVYKDRTNYEQTGKITTLIFDPKLGTLVITITNPNYETTFLMGFLLSTITFSDEALQNKITECPTSWSADGQTATIHGIQFAAKDLDKEHISTYCGSTGIPPENQ